MSLLTPSFGLLFWMVLIFGLLFFVLAKFGFPAISSMVSKRSDYIEESLKKADAARKQLEEMALEHEKMIEETRLEQQRILKQATEAGNRIITEAKQQAGDEAAKIIERAKTEIAAERESVLRDLANTVSMVSVQVAEKIVRKDLEGGSQQLNLVEQLLSEASKSEVKS